MNDPQPMELPSFLSPLSFPPIQEPEDEDSIRETTIEAPPRVDVTRTSATEPLGTTQEFVPPHNLNAQAIEDPEENPERWDRAELVLAISPRLTPIREASEEDLLEDSLEASNPESSPRRSADEENSTLRAVASTSEGSSKWPSSKTTFTATSIVQNPSLSDIMHPENFPNPVSWIPPVPESNASSADDTADASTEVSANDVGSSIIFDLGDDYHSDTSNYTASLLSDVKDYAYENGRRYHSYREGHYVLPNDEQEQDRQDLLHHVRNLVLNGALFRAPLDKSVQRVLDIGTGTGIWAIDFADSYPSAEVIGTDLSPIQPSWVPPNVRFIVDDAEEPWLFSASRPFDFIHARDLGGAIGDWPRLLRQAYTHLKPGGWIELQEFEVTLKSDDGTMRLAPTLCEYLGRLHEASEAFQRPMNIAEGHRQRLVEAGFENVQDAIYKVCMP